MEETHFTLNYDDAVGIDSPSKRRKTSTSTEHVHHPGDQVEVYTPQQVTLKNYEVYLPAYDLPASKDVVLGDFLTEDDMSWINNVLYDDSEDATLKDVVGFSPEVIDGSLATGLLPKDQNVGTSEGFSIENHDSVSQSDEDIFTCAKFDEDSLIGKEYRDQEAGGRAVLHTANSNGDFPTGINKCDPFKNTLGKQYESQGHGVFLPCSPNVGNNRNSPIPNTPNNGKNSPSRGNGTWVPVGSDLLPRVEYCPDALVDYLLGSEDRISKDINHNSAITKVRMHLSHLGWKIECTRDGNTSNSSTKFRYISPDGKTKYSLIDVYKNLTQTMTQSPNSQIDSRNLVNVTDKLLDSKVRLSRKLDRQQGYEGGVSTSHGQSPVSDIYKTERGQVGDGSSSSCLEASALNLRGEKKASMDLVPDEADIEPEYCPQAVIDWCHYESNRKKMKSVSESGGARRMSLKAKKHLLAVGWKLWRTVKQKKKLELRYTSPKGKSYVSLVRACKGYMEEEGLFGSMRPTEGMIASEKSKGPLSVQKPSSATTCTMADESPLPISRQSEKGYTELLGSSKLKELECSNIQGKEIIRHQEKQKNMSFPLSSKVLQSQTSAQDGIVVPNLHNRGLRQSLDRSVNSHEKKKGEASRSLHRVEDQLDVSYQTCLSRSSKRARQVTVLSSMHQTPRTVLSWLLDSNVVLPRAKVYCMGRKDYSRMTKGRVTPHGIRCNCCQKVFSLTKFEAHAGSTNCRPAASIFLEDGRSMLQCQMQIVGHKLKGFRSKPLKRIKRNNLPDKSDDICLVCHYGGNLLLCDQCPSSFHLSCLGLKDLPEGNWSCPSCRCGICERSEFDGDTEKFTEKTVLYCDQCEREYHVGCIRQRELVKLESCPKGNWFCSKNCEKIFESLHELLGKSFPVDVNNFSWTILKASKDDYHDMDELDIKTMAEHHSKLNVALGVIHECFEPIKQPHSKRDLVEDVLFNRRSELNRLNFRGFYTVLLEKDDELISVATVRVHGKNMAEVPLVCTRVQYRRQGMCHILMNVIEKTLAELGVKKLILPAILQMLLSWTTSFGFSMMTNFERLKFLEYTYLDFQDTTMCQKILTTTFPEKSTESRAPFTGNQRKLGDGSNPNVDMDSVGSEVIQAERIKQRGGLEKCNSLKLGVQGPSFHVHLEMVCM
ncbi:GNAT domain [Macleaya cordata]|uniref:GNAT domain n=1 Tax=Macleaya cordata TaxID=56857 RepID=A0A200PWX5_MACCD|nr:GNAT domain [Macleaya cordata]